MSAGRYDLEIEQGATFTRVLIVSEGGAVKDLTGYAARAQIRRTASSTVVLQSITATVTDPTDGEVTLSLTASQTALLDSIRGVWDLEIDDQDITTPVVTRLLEGSVTVIPNVTR